MLEAGLTPHTPSRITAEDCVRALQAASSDGLAPSRRRWDAELHSPGSRTIIRRLNIKSSTEAVQIAGLSTSEGQVKRRARHFSDEEILNQLQAAAREVPEPTPGWWLDHRDDPAKHPSVVTI